MKESLMNLAERCAAVASMLPSGQEITREVVGIENDLRELANAAEEVGGGEGGGEEGGGEVAQ